MANDRWSWVGFDAEVEKVDPRVREAMAREGFVAKPNGGPFSAWMKDLGEGGSLTVSADATEDGGTVAGDPDKPIWFAYRNGGENGFVANSEGKTLDEAIAFAKALPSPVGSDGDLQVYGEDVASIEAAIAAPPRAP